jgi:hypothetical protein
MAIQVPDTRQSPLVAIASFVYTDFTSGVGVPVAALPQGAVVTGGYLIVDTAFDGSSTVAADVGDAGTANRYESAQDVKSGADIWALTPTGYSVVNANRNVLLEITAGGTITAGAGRIIVEYVVDGRSTENFE